MDNSEVKIGDHCWALMDGDLLVVIKVFNDSYQVCGDWEENVDADELHLIEVIEKPHSLAGTRLYYART